MDVREKLVELLKTNACPAPFMCDPACRYYGYGDCFPDRFADHLIAHGVTVQECKLGDKKTNADRIRSMSDAQLVQMLTIGRGGFSCSKCAESEDCGQNCEVQCLKWLQQPAEEADND